MRRNSHDYRGRAACLCPYVLEDKGAFSVFLSLNLSLNLFMPCRLFPLSGKDLQAS